MTLSEFARVIGSFVILGALVGAAAPAAAATLPSPACEVTPDGGRCHWDGPTRAARLDTIPVPTGVRLVAFTAKGDTSCRYVPEQPKPICSPQAIVSGNLDVTNADTIDISVGGYLGSANISLVAAGTTEHVVFAPGFAQSNSRPFGPEGSVISSANDGGLSEITLSWTT